MKKHKIKLIKIKPIKFRPLDSDRDGVIDSKDCQPFNPKKQDWNMEKARQSGSTIEYMTPDKYIRKTGLNPEENSNYYYDYLEKYYDDEKEESRPIKELSDLIKNPKKKITIPYVGESPCEHEGRHRAYAAKLAGYKKIPVVVPSLKNYSMEERTKLGEKFVKIKGYVGSYAHEWIGRFERGNPESYMDSSNRKILVKMLKEEKK